MIVPSPHFFTVYLKDITKHSLINAYCYGIIISNPHLVCSHQMAELDKRTHLSDIKMNRSILLVLTDLHLSVVSTPLQVIINVLFIFSAIEPQKKSLESLFDKGKEKNTNHHGTVQRPGERKSKGDAFTEEA